MIAVKLDVTKVDKSKLFEGKNGAKYLDVVLIPTPDSRYGHDYMAVQGVSKEDREKGIKGAILGNAKTFTRQSERPTSEPEPAEKKSDDLPF